MTTENHQLARTREDNLSAILERPEYKNRFQEVLGMRAPQFVSSLLSLSMSSLRDADPKSVIAAGMTAASLNLPINPNLGFAYIIPYRTDGRVLAQFQMGYKGFVQLCQRTGQYRHMNACRVFEGELVKYDKLTGQLEIDEARKKSDKVIGYASYFGLVTGFQHAMYMTREEMEKHAKRYSQAYRKGTSVWNEGEDGFDKMAMKTVLKLNLQKWGPMNVQLERAYFEDQAMRHEVDTVPIHADNIEPIQRAQIEGPQPPEGHPDEPGLPEEPGPAGEPAPTEAPKSTRQRKKKEATPAAITPAPLQALASSKSEEAAEVAEAPPNPRLIELTKKLNAAGYLMSQFMEVARVNQWIDEPENFDGDFATIPIPEEKLTIFLLPDSWQTIVDQLALKFPKVAQAAEQGPFE